MLKLIALLLLPLIAGAWSFQGHQLLTGLGLHTLTTLEFVVPLLILSAFILVFLWDKGRLRAERLGRLLPQLLLMSFLLGLLSLGQLTDDFETLGTLEPKSWLLLLGPLTLSLGIALTHNLWNKGAFANEAPVLQELTREPELKSESQDTFREFLRFIHSSTGANEVVLLQYQNGKAQRLSAHGEGPASGELGELTALMFKDLRFVPGLGDIPLRVTEQRLEILLPLGSGLGEDLYLAWDQPFELQGERLQKLIDLRRVMASLVSQTKGSSLNSASPGFSPLLWNQFLGLVLLPILLYVGLYLRGSGSLILSILPWSSAGIPSFLAIGLGYYCTLVFTWTGEQRRLSQVWRWHRSQSPRVASLVWINKLRMIRNLTSIVTLFGVVNVLSNLDKPEKIGPGISVALIAPVYQCFAYLFSLPALVFGSFALPKDNSTKAAPADGRSIGLSVLLGFMLLIFGLLAQAQLAEQLRRWEVCSQLVFWLAAMSAYLLSKISWRDMGTVLMCWKKPVSIELPREGLRVLWIYSALGLLSFFAVTARCFLELGSREGFLQIISQVYPVFFLWVIGMLLVIFPLSVRIDQSIVEVRQ